MTCRGGSHEAVKVAVMTERHRYRQLLQLLLLLLLLLQLLMLLLGLRRGSIRPHLRRARQSVARDLMNERRQMRSLTGGHCASDRSFLAARPTDRSSIHSAARPPARAAPVCARFHRRSIEIIEIFLRRKKDASSSRGVPVCVRCRLSDDRQCFSVLASVGDINTRTIVGVAGESTDVNRIRNISSHPRQ